MNRMKMVTVKILTRRILATIRWVKIPVNQNVSAHWKKTKFSLLVRWKLMKYYGFSLPLPAQEDMDSCVQMAAI